MPKKQTPNKTKTKKRTRAISTQFQNAARELRIRPVAALTSIREISKIRRKMPIKKFARFEKFLEAFGETAMKDLTARGVTEMAAEKRTRELIEIIRQARWINIRTGIKRRV